MAESRRRFGTPCTTWEQEDNLCYRCSEPRPDFSTLNATGRRMPRQHVCPTCPPYLTTTSTGAVIVPGTTDIGNHCDDLPIDRSLPGYTFRKRPTRPARLSRPARTAVWTRRQRLSVWHILFRYPIRESIGRSFRSKATCGQTISLTRARASSSRPLVSHLTATLTSSGALRIHGGGQVNLKCTPREYKLLRRHLWRDFDNGAAEESGVQKSTTGPATHSRALTGTLPAMKVQEYCPNSCPGPVPTPRSRQRTTAQCGVFDVNLPLVPCWGRLGSNLAKQGAASSDRPLV